MNDGPEFDPNFYNRLIDTVLNTYVESVGEHAVKKIAK